MLSGHQSSNLRLINMHQAFDETDLSPLHQGDLDQKCNDQCLNNTWKKFTEQTLMLLLKETLPYTVI